MMVYAPLAAGNGGQKLPRESFVNSMRMKMIAVKGGSFDAWTPSLARYGRMMVTCPLKSSPRF
ncbi:MAG: hypothetical protein QGH33_20855, partial [Pirellulaceae bacterium]|nr:hypothetical protein [Pirellulaceae bacterium]